MSDPHVVVIGAGIGGLVSALLLARQGCKVQVVEAMSGPGGKMREVRVDNRLIDAGPTVFTMRSVFEEIFATVGEKLEDHLHIHPAHVLARHAWESKTGPSDNQPKILDLFASREESADAIARFSSPDEGRRYLAFCKEAKAIHDTLEVSFMRVPRPSQVGLVMKAGFRPMLATRPFTSMAKALAQHFNDPRLQQLFGRYATYCGSSPYLSPATLMLIAHVEQEGVWLIEGGMHRLAQALAGLVVKNGGTIRYHSSVARILVSNGKASGVVLHDGSQIAADAIVMNGDSHALASGLMGESVQSAVTPTTLKARSLSAVTWNMVAKTDGFLLSRHNVFFSVDYRQEFHSLSTDRAMPDDPTVYVCAQDRDDLGKTINEGPERLLVLVNAPAIDNAEVFHQEEIVRCQQRMIRKLEACGLMLSKQPAPPVITTPRDFAAMFPGSAGALYGRATHGAMASFTRPAARSTIPGLYLAGGSIHPGAGVPMVALSGRIAATSLMTDWISQRPSRPAVTAGGMSTH
jgi:1-hydroxycarotenoid 3,4-desaturase